ncbi:hydroxyethylthiazole kinase [Proteiniborus sp.]|uniref:hydroxyethylthiazole kinase n=1 Tax=Proteiniborus sp. TaxID=2079015 RepID=UPI00332E070F
MEILQEVARLLPKIRGVEPLIHHITNFVTINDCANITLAIGGSPIMAYDETEVEEVVSMSSSLVLNIGTLSLDMVRTMILAGKKANELNIPVILDPVGVGATRLRSKAIEDILSNVKITVIKGNMSEIKIVSGLEVEIRGVDSIADNKESGKTAKELASKLGCIVAITGKQDVLSDGNKVFYVNNGHEMLSKVTGTGCMTSSLIASYCGVTSDYLTAALGGVVSMGIAGEIAFNSLKDNEGLGSFKVNLFDNIYNLNPDIIMKAGEISVQ